MNWTMPLRYSIPLLLAGVGLALTAIAFYDGLKRTESLLENETYAHAVSLGTRLVAVTEVRLRRGDADLAFDAITRVVTERHLRRAVLFDSQWNIVVSTDYRLRSQNFSAMTAPVDLRELGARTLATMTAQPAWASDRNSLHCMFLVVLDTTSNVSAAASPGVLYLEYDLSELKRINLAEHMQRAWLMGAVILLSLAIVWWFVYWSVTRRLARFADAIERAAEGRAAPDMKAAGMDELGKFSASIQRIVTELRASGAALAESESRYRSVIHAMSEGVYILDGEGKLLTANASGLKLLGLAEPQPVIVFDPKWKLIDESGRQLDPEEYPGVVALRTGQPVTNAIVGLHDVSGTLRWVSVNSEPVWLDAAQTQRGVVSTVADITDRRVAELQSLRDRERLAAIVGSAMDAVICTDGDLRITLFNRAAETIFGHRQQDMLGQPLDRLLPERHRNGHQTMMQRFADTAKTSRVMGVPGEVTGVRANGEEVSLEASISRVQVGDEVVLTAILRDISERKRAEAQRELLEAQLRQSQKLQSLGTLTGGIAHDFNNILTAISGNAKLAQLEMRDEHFPDSHPVQRSMREIEKAAARATDLVRQVLAFGRHQEAQRAPLNFSAVVGEALKFLRSTLPALIEIRSRLPDDLPLVAADATQIHQVLANLVSNAAHAIGDRPGMIDVELDTATLDGDSSLDRPDLPSGRYVCLTVADTGRGIDPDIMERIYEPFFTTKPVGVGTGLGLSVVHGIVKNHDGAIVVKSEPNHGARFQIYFPAVEAGAVAAAAAEQKGEAAETTAFPGKTIVYLDDEEALVFLVTRLLERRGYRVLGFTHPEKALDALATKSQVVDVVVSDLAMPGMSGFDVVRKAHALRPGIPVVLVSGYVRPQDTELAQQLGVRRLILKPDTVEALATVLLEILESKGA